MSEPSSIVLRYGISTLLIVSACQSSSSIRPGDGGPGQQDAPSNDGGTPSDATETNDGATACQTPAPQDLFPPFDFSTDDGSFVIVDDGNTCIRPPDEGGPPSMPPPGEDGGPAMVNRDGGPPPLDDPGSPPPDGGPQNGGTIGRVLVGFLNPFGRHADQIMPDVAISGPVGSLDDFAGNQPLGTNGRHCETCHGNQQGWTSTPASFQDRFDNGVLYLTARCPKRVATNESATTNDELEPIFRTKDGTNSPLADVSTPAARRSAYSMLLTKAVIRIGLPAPGPEGDYDLVAVDDPYGFASARELSLFRRSPVMANLRFTTTVMWDGRETIACATLTASLHEQAKNAITGHAEGPIPSDEAVATIVRGEMGLYSAQFIDTNAGPLNESGARGGPTFLAQVPFYWGINAFDKTDPQGRRHDKEVFTLYRAWLDLAGDSARDQARRQIAEGERLFNNRQFTVSGVSGFNDELGRARITATCGACHNTPNVGTNSEGRLMDIGVSDESQRTADLPLYTFREKATGALKRSSDPGQALATKKWAHLNRFKVPILRSLAVREPYLHNGAASTLAAAVEYHNQRFDIGLSAVESAALTAFLSAL